MHRTPHRMLAVAAAFALVSSAKSARAQYSPDRATALEVRKEFITDLDSLHSKFTALAEAIPADKYSWRPAPGVRSIGEVFMHIASEFYFWTPAVFGAKPSPVVEGNKASLDKFEKMASKPEVLKHLKEGFAYGRAAVSDLEDSKITGTQKVFGHDRQIVEMTLDMTDDLHEHLGQLIAYARMNGIKPPWSK